MMYTKLKKVRKKTGLMQSTVAKKAKISLRAYQYYESGERIPDVQIAKLIARALNSTVEELF